MKWKYVREHHRRQDKARSESDPLEQEEDNALGVHNVPLHNAVSGNLYRVTVRINRKPQSWTMRAPNPSEAWERLTDLGYKVVRVVACD